MSGFAQSLADLPNHQSGLLAVFLLYGLPLSWRSAGPPERAALLTLTGIAAMDLLVLLYANGSALLHLVADGLALSWMLPVALRANRFYPAVIAAALLVAVLAQLLNLLGLTRDAGSVTFLVNGLHLLAVLALLGGSLVHRRIVAEGARRPAWRISLSQG
ncbi:MAG: hypothetical protein C0515_11360 [Novosphingobium sp.]|nr:hypothetical protein [Novosphingobium sp.]MBX9642910.1 hypothetical protein [Novosphingobium sp.]